MISLDRILTLVLLAACGGPARGVLPATVVQPAPTPTNRNSDHWCINTIEVQSTATPETYLGTARAEGHTITGTFRNARTGERLAGAVVIAELPPFRAIELTDDAGSYRIVVAPGSYRVTAYYMETLVVLGDVVVP